jgi:hypothetical protein
MAPCACSSGKENDTSQVADRVVDAARRVAHVTADAERLASAASEAIEDGVAAARRAAKSVRRSVEDLGELPERALHRVKREPLVALAAALGVGVALGLAVGWVGGRARARRT